MWVVFLQGLPPKHLAIPLAILIAQQLQYITYATKTTHLKLIAGMHNKVHDAMLQVSLGVCYAMHARGTGVQGTRGEHRMFWGGSCLLSIRA
jgi:hypothetical protein